MKFHTLPRFTQMAGYRVNVPLAYLREQLSHFTEQGLIMEPDFQRAHVWTPEQGSAYIEYLLRGGTSGREIYFNLYRFQTGVCGSEKYPFVLVDGLQRLTACLEFLSDKLCAFGHRLSEFEDKLPTMEPSLLFNVNDLKTRAQVLQWYCEMNSGGTPHTKEELDKVKKLLDEEGTTRK